MPRPHPCFPPDPDDLTFFSESTSSTEATRYAVAECLLRTNNWYVVYGRPLRPGIVAARLIDDKGQERAVHGVRRSEVLSLLEAPSQLRRRSAELALEVLSPQVTRIIQRGQGLQRTAMTKFIEFDGIGRRRRRRAATRPSCHK